MSNGLPHLVPIISGQPCIGFLIAGPRGVEAYDRNEQSLGIFPDVMAAAVAVEKSVAPACPGCSE
jgi:hypothetical protein